jgi:hypothetical protein
MHGDIPSSVDPHWKPSTTILIRKRTPMPKTNKGERAKGTRLVLPGVFRAHRNADRRGLLHVAECGTRQTGTRKDATTFLAASGTKVGMPLNPTGMTLCGLQGGTHVPGEFDRLLGEGRWCECCRRALDLYLIRQEVTT